ncbi:MAG: CoA-binding protein [Meiothermus sp.]|uniref:CoA-binding protein n=1 Tax=Meiothermus sp. TaxID=1955249 RepID=UPI0025F8BD7F|nr:CoA-binding protein [Meiothermus sp.]MCS7057379.1 CoA-binding protein [Meiothermus sp.]MCS7193616.1 CoA-binding protein [Meiothermus sp.]MCX7741093.1 CoA-binding protein [Meiothermus sp.]MDW8090630.1 CoA-binding protein [Meiothermus sp.]MDW8480546.1 CoA-binding protein [Meiothermus sp.]
MSPPELRALLQSARTVAVLGAHPNPVKPAHYVPAYLKERGYELLPVNPAYAGQVLWGREVVGCLDELEGPVDILNVFRRSEVLLGHLEEVLRLRPGLVWLQSGIRNQVFAQRLEQAGIPVVQDRCLMVEHRRLLG